MPGKQSAAAAATALALGVTMLTGFAQAQDLGGIDLSDSCKEAAISLVTSEFGSCANLIGLTNIVTASGSVVQPLNSWIDSMCNSAPCSDSTLSSAADTIKSGCQEDINGNNDIVMQLNNVVENYNNVRDTACLQYSGNGTWCAPYLLDNIQNASGTELSPANVTSMFSSVEGLQMLYSDTPASAVCNDCGKAVAVQAQQFDPSGGENVQNVANSKCGESFAGTEMPATVQENAASADEAASSAGGDSQSEGSGAESLSLVNVQNVAIAFGAALSASALSWT